MPEPIYASGPQPADIMLVGESPGREESPGNPFANRTGAGGILNNCLKATGIERANIRITNTIHRKYAKEASPQDVKDLLQEIEFTQPKIIVAFGNVPLGALLSKIGIMRHRGSVYPLRINADMTVNVIPTVHPAAILRMWKWKPLLEFDMARMKEILYHGYTKPEYKFITCPPVGNLDHALHKVYESKIVAVDIETIHNEFISCIGVAWNENESICIRLDTPQAFRFVERVLGDPSIEKGFHFGCYDRYHLFRYGFKIEGRIFDTINAHHVLWSELPHGLDFLCSVYTNQPYYKDYMKSWTTEPHWPRLVEYNSLDCVVTRRAMNELKKEMSDEGMSDVYERLYPRLADVTLKMSMKGIKVDIEKRTERLQEFEKKVDKAQLLLNEIAGTELNAKSPPQVKKALADRKSVV